jgi:hypothetical protein
MAVLTEDAQAWSDGGGKVTAARRVIRGAGRVARFLAGIVRKAPPGLRLAPATVNGRPARLLLRAETVVAALSIEADAAGRVSQVFIVRNPDKLSAARPRVSACPLSHRRELGIDPGSIGQDPIATEDPLAASLEQGQRGIAPVTVKRQLPILNGELALPTEHSDRAMDPEVVRAVRSDDDIHPVALGPACRQTGDRAGPFPGDAADVRDGNGRERGG